MTTLRISLICLACAAAAGSLSLIPGNFWLSPPAPLLGPLRALSVAGLVGFAVSFMVGLDRRSLVKP